MKVAGALRGVGRLFLDSAPVIYYVERNPAYVPVVDAVFDRIDNGTLPCVTSPVTLAECLVVPRRLGDAAAEQAFVNVIVRAAGVAFVFIEEDAARRAADLRARHNLSLADALQVATALEFRCGAFLTNDRKLRRVSGINVVVVDELEPDS